MAQRLELTWIDKDKPILPEPRILVENTTLSFHADGLSLFDDATKDNLLIHGDNLLALKALEKSYGGQVKCIYIDPPYNTGYAFENYDDNLEHSIWLNLMRHRLIALQKLLKSDGTIAVQIGFDEMAYLKVIMDEIFGRDHCLGQIAVRMSHSAGMKRKAMDKRFIKNAEYILIYFNKEAPEIQPLYEVCDEYPVNYYQYIVSLPEDNKPGKFVSFIDVLYKEFEEEFVRYKLPKSNKSIAFLFKNVPAVYDYVIGNKTKICRKDSNVPNLVNEPTGLCEDEFVEAETTTGERYFVGINSANNFYQLYSLEDKVKCIDVVSDDGTIMKKEVVTNLIGDWWDSFYKDMSRVDVEGGVKMKTSKKPERLIKWIFDSLTKPNDIVLDSFLGLSSPFLQKF